MSNSRSRNGRHQQAPPIQMQVPLIGQGQGQPRVPESGLTNANQIEPLHDFIVIRELPMVQMYGSIVMPNAETDIVKAEVVSIGPGRYSDVMDWRPPIEIKKGDIVFVTGNTLPMHCGKDNLFMVRYTSLIGKMTDDAAKIYRESIALADSEKPASLESLPSKLIT